jgi:flagellar hook protein FlgE
MFVGLTGLTAMGHNIDVIGNNIANVNTVGFRSGRASFDDIYNQTLFSGVGATGNQGGINPRQIGTGVKMGSVDRIFTQGSMQTTGRLLDLSINGNGFFVLRDGANQEYLTRAGNFSLDNQGYIVDPGTGYRLIGRPGDSIGEVRDTEPPGALQIDFARKSFAKVTQTVTAGGNFDARVGDPISDKETQPALTTTNLLGLFDDGGIPFGLVNGDVLQFETGWFELSDPPKSVQSPLNLTQFDTGRGDGVILTVTQTTTINDLKVALTDYFKNTIGQIDPGAESGIEVKFDNATGNFEFTNFGSNALKGIRIGVAPRSGMETPPDHANRMVGELFIEQGDPNFTKTINVESDSVTKTNKLRRADSTSSIDVFDSKGNARTVTVGLAAHTDPPAANSTTLVSEMLDSEGRQLIPGGIIPPKVEYFDPQIDSATNTAIFTARQISNMLVTQGVFSFEDANGTMIAMRLSDGALYFDDGTTRTTGFVPAVTNSGTFDAAIDSNGLNVTGDAFLNVKSQTNPIGGILGDEGITESTTLEDIRNSLENRINGAIRQIAANLGNVTAASGDFNAYTNNGTTIDLAAPTDIPQITIELTNDGAFRFSSTGGSLGASASSDSTITTNLANAVGGEDKMGFMVDLAAKTRSIRVSTIDDGGTIWSVNNADDIADGKVDDDYTDGGGVTGFIKGIDPFSGDAWDVFAVGNTDASTLINDSLYPVGAVASPYDGSPTASPDPTGIDDSGTYLIALSSGLFPNNNIQDTTTGQGLTDEAFNGGTAFPAKTTAFLTLFNKRGYGMADNYDGMAGIDRPGNVPVGVVARYDDSTPFEMNAIHKEGITRSTVNYQAVVPNDYRSIPTQNTGTLIFDSTGRFARYENGTEPPTISFDPDALDPADGGVSALTFKLDMRNITNFSADHTAQLQSQDGRPVGFLDNVSISTGGDIIGIFTNGDTQTLGKLLLATVTNEDGLLQVKDTMFTLGPNVGDRIFVEAGVEGGTITSGQLELSNVDLAQEFTNLIVAQRAYQASARLITTGDAILQEVVSLKR